VTGLILERLLRVDCLATKAGLRPTLVERSLTAMGTVMRLHRLYRPLPGLWRDKGSRVDRARPVRDGGAPGFKSSGKVTLGKLLAGTALDPGSSVLVAPTGFEPVFGHGHVFARSLE
jgi:hypothetical protein